jgi:excisionase family DNA binding protein
MNKAEAAKYLEIGVRSLERYTSEGRLKPGRVRTKTGPALDYDEEELATFKAELQAELEVETQGAAPRPAEGSQRGSATLAKVQHQVLTLPPVQGTKSESEPQILVPLEVLASLAARLGEASKQPHVETANKLLLNLEECAALTGLSKAALRAAVASGELAGRKMGRSIRVRREELERWVHETC